jgi:hypothetical protein
LRQADNESVAADEPRLVHRGSTHNGADLAGPSQVLARHLSARVPRRVSKLSDAENESSTLGATCPSGRALASGAMAASCVVVTSV